MLNFFKNLFYDYSDITLRILFLVCKSVILFICRFNNLTGFIFMTIDLEMPCFQLKIILRIFLLSTVQFKNLVQSNFL